MPSDATPLPLTIISGYLGSGKTTLVNHLLRHANGRRLVVLVNDFGELAIDADLIEFRDGDTLNLANGCACCSMGGDLFNALVDVLDRTPRPDHLLIEASGVADPARIANIALAEPDLKLDAIIGLVDGHNFLKQSSDPLVGQSVCDQLSSANLVLLNKMDLISPNKQAAVKLKIAELVNSAPQLETVFSKAPVEALLGISLFSTEGGVEQRTAGNLHDHDYEKWAIDITEPFDRPAFEKALSKCAKSSLRIKGIVFFKDSVDAYVVQCVAQHCSITAVDNTFGSTSRLIAIGIRGQLPEFNFTE